MAFSNGLSPQECERLALVMEEMAEVSQVIGKILRHGYDSFNPTIPKADTNRLLLAKEIGDVAYALNLLSAAEDVDMVEVSQSFHKKAETFRHWNHHQPEALLDEAAKVE